MASAAPLLVVCAAISVTTGTALAVKLFSTVGPVGTIWMRNLLAASVVTLWPRRALRRSSQSQTTNLVVLGLILAALNVCFYEAIERIPLGVATTVEFIGPLGVAVAGSKRLLDLVWVALAAAGVALLGAPSAGVDGVGLVLASAAAILWAGYILVSKRLVDAVGATTALTGALWVSARALAPFALLSGRASSLVRPGVVATALAVAILSAALPNLLELIVLRTVRAAAFSILLSLEPAAAAVMGFVILGQDLRPVEILSVLLVWVASSGASHRGTP